MAASRISPRQQAAIAYLLANPSATASAVASAVHVSERTVRRWLHDQEFQAAFTIEMDAAFRVQVARVKAIFGKALTWFDKILAEDDEIAVSPATKTRAAIAVAAMVRQLGVVPDGGVVDLRIVEVPAEEPMDQWISSTAKMLAAVEEKKREILDDQSGDDMTSGGRKEPISSTSGKLRLRVNGRSTQHEPPPIPRAGE